MESENFRQLIGTIVEFIAGRPLDGALELELNERFPAQGSEVQQIKAACLVGIAAGWMCNRENGGIRFGRVIKPGPSTHGFSVDVVDMESTVGPHHRHPDGEIDLIVPLSPNAKFDGHGAGWRVYEADSAHYPSVSNGRALVLYLLPEGKIEFTQT